MGKFENVSGGLLILPDGKEIESGKTVELSKEMLENAGVKHFIKAKQLARPSGKS